MEDKLASFICEKCKSPIAVTDELFDQQRALQLQQEKQNSGPTTINTKSSAQSKVIVNQPVQSMVDFNLQSAPDASLMILSPAPQLFKEEIHLKQSASLPASRQSSSMPGTPQQIRRVNLNSASQQNSLPQSLQIPSQINRRLSSSPKLQSKLHRKGLSYDSRAESPSQSTSKNSSINQVTDQLQQLQLNQQDNQWFQKVQQMRQYFQLLSEDTEFQFPTCVDCYDMAEKQYRNVIDQLSEEVQMQKNCISMLSEESKQLNLDEQSDKDDETDLKRQIDELNQEKNLLLAELEQLEEEKNILDVQEEEINLQISQKIRDQHIAQEKFTTSQLLYQDVKRSLDIVKNVNIYNEVFHIWHQGPFGTINGFRLGKLATDAEDDPKNHVEWPEINAALGWVCLLLDTLSRKIPYQFKQNRIIPMGSYSKIVHLDAQNGDDYKGTTYELYGTEEFQLSRLFWNKRFDTGMTMLLGCIQELEDYANKDVKFKDEKFKLPHKIDKDLIGGVCIKLQHNEYEIWTRALKFMLTDLKWLLNYFCQQHY